MAKSFPILEVVFYLSTFVVDSLDSHNHSPKQVKKCYESAQSKKVFCSRVNFDKYEKQSISM